METMQDIFHIGEHRSCNNCLSELHTSFCAVELSKGEVFNLKELPLNYIFCFLEGSCSFRTQSYSARTFHATEMILVPRMASCHGVATEPMRLLIFGFEQPDGRYCKLNSEEYIAQSTRINYNFEPTPLKEPLRRMVELFADNLQAGINCTPIHELKHLEFFLLLHSCYEKEELVRLFYPLIGAASDFRNTILANYRNTSAISELIRCSGVSRSTFFVRFRQEFGMTAKEWIAERIRQDIMRMASSEELTAAEIMRRLHFTTAQQFTRFCRHNYGTSSDSLIRNARENGAKEPLTAKPAL